VKEVTYPVIFCGINESFQQAVESINQQARKWFRENPQVMISEPLMPTENVEVIRVEKDSMITYKVKAVWFVEEEIDQNNEIVG